MRNSDRFYAWGLTIVVLWTAAAPAQVAPLVPLSDDKAGETLLPAGITRNQPEVFGQYAQVWALDDGTHVIQYYGDFSLHLGERRLNSRDAVIWMRKTEWKDFTYYHYELFLSTEALVRDSAGTVNSGPTLFVTFNSYQPPQLEMDSSSAEPAADTTLFREGSRVRQEVLAGQPETGEPRELAVIDLRREGKADAPKAKPIIRYRSTQPAIIDEKAGTITITGNVYLSQGLVESGQFVEIRANAAVLFLAKEQPKPAAEQDVLAPQPALQPGVKSGSTEAGQTAGAFGAVGSGFGGAGGAVAGVYLKGDVVLTRGERAIRADELYYDLENERALMLDAVMRTSIPGQEIPLYVRADQIRQLSSAEFMARKARVSTSDFHTPHVHLGAEEMTFADATPRGDSGQIAGLQAGRYEARDVTLNLDGVPVTYWPYAAGDFRQGESALRGVRVSYGDDFGASVQSKWYLYNLLGLDRPKGVDAILLSDYFSKRGPGMGTNVDYETDHSFGLFRGYYISDHGEDDLGSFRDGTVDHDDRGRITLRHREYLPQGWQLTLEGSYVSDPHFLEEYFKNEFEEGKEQETLVYLKKQQDNWAFTALGQWRVLDFLTQTEHMPDLGFHWIGEPLAELASFYNESHVGFVRYLPDDRYFFDKHRIGDNNERSDLTFRGDTRNEVDLPIKLGSTQVVPYAMARTGYWDGSASGSSLARLFGSAGVRASTQFWRVFDNVVSKLLDLNGLRHIIKPEITAWLSGANHDSIDLYPFDRGIEDINDFYGSSLALRQRWQTKRGGPGNWRVIDWITLDVELNVFGGVADYITKPIGRYYDYRPENSNPRDHVRTDFSFRLSDTTTLLADANWGLSGDLDLFNISYAIEQTPRFSYALGYRRIGPTDSNLFGVGANYEFNSKYRGAVRTYYDVERSQLAQFDVTLVRKWPQWYTAVTFGLDDIEDEIHISMSAWPEGAPQMALGNRRYTGLGQSTGIRPNEE